MLPVIYARHNMEYSSVITLVRSGKFTNAKRIRFEDTLRVRYFKPFAIVQTIELLLASTTR
jgi:hypothetical protein